ncbi:hypothetical protein HMPREF9371_1894 [Neisseria shayeganii 871]|uniref:Uncharacterized protein n=1 Tax=Neisseria shayeganii 871 TaxID=1032488 RepID=G4CJV4_9NEIS|nr:hypothetical protein HMPREF9371_1894 [Neisseria shayeganii 871]
MRRRWTVAKASGYLKAFISQHDLIYRTIAAPAHRNQPAYQGHNFHRKNIVFRPKTPATLAK